MINLFLSRETQFFLTYPLLKENISLRPVLTIQIGAPIVVFNEALGTLPLVVDKTSNALSV